MIIFYVLPLLTLLLPTTSIATPLFEVDDNYPPTKGRKGITVNVAVSKYYPTDTKSALYRVLKQAQILTAHVSFAGDGVPYKQHSWNAGSDTANLKRGIDCSRAIWFAFTRAGVPYNPQNRYLDTSRMWSPNSEMKHYFHSCSINDLRLGDVLVYRGGGKGHTVMVLDPQRKLAWGSHGWDKSRHKDTGVEVQKVALGNWRYWDRYRMQFKACWRHRYFSQQPIISTSPSTLGQYPETHLRALGCHDLEDKTRYALWIMRNEMFARYGYRFKNKALAVYFKQWYQSNELETNPNDIFNYQFSDLERSNVKLIYQYEKNRINNLLQFVATPFKTPNQITDLSQPAGDYPETSIRQLTCADIADKSQQELRLMRNEIFARYGYRFNDSELQNYFERQSWYKPITIDATNLYDHQFTPIEQYNIKFIQQYE